MKPEQALKSGAVILGCLAGTAAELFVGGCSASRIAVAADEVEAPAALTAVGAPLRFEPTPSRDQFHLGAGDNLGAAVFSNYLEVVQANGGGHYASGSSR